MSEQPDLVFVIPGLWATGGFRTLYEWCNRLADSGHRVRVVTHCGGPGASLLSPAVQTILPSRSEAVRAGPLRLAVNKILGDHTFLDPVPPVLRHLIPQDGTLILCWIPWWPVLPQGRPAILYAQHWEPVWFKPATRSYRGAVKGMHLPLPTIVNSSWLRLQFPADRQEDLELVFPGVDQTVFHPSRAPRSPHPRLRIVGLGRTEPLKGLAELRQAVARLATRDLSCELVLFGTQTRYERSGSEVTEIGLGQLSSADLAALYRSADLVVTPSWYESFPLPPLEAMACGAPVITTRPGTEDFAIDGHNALVVPPRDVMALSRGLERVARDHDLRHALGDNGAQTALRFTWDAGFSMFEWALERFCR